MSDFRISVDSAPLWIWTTLLAVVLLDHEFPLVYFWLGFDADACKAFQKKLISPSANPTEESSDRSREVRAPPSQQHAASVDGLIEPNTNEEERSHEFRAPPSQNQAASIDGSMAALTSETGGEVEHLHLPIASRKHRRIDCGAHVGDWRGSGTPAPPKSKPQASTDRYSGQGRARVGDWRESGTPGCQNQPEHPLIETNYNRGGEIPRVQSASFPKASHKRRRIDV
ncbi:hypothetical protein B0H13DRAFT_1853526 [Mycena leptocephala]|nr:hypothetical protein B0H13DRAFT_1853526 [Mycena leptocephala]